MAINYSLSVGSVKKRLVEGEFNDVIIEANFCASAYSEIVTETNIDGEEVVATPSFSYACNVTKRFNVSEIDPTTFVPFEQITKETIIEWLLADEGVASVEDLSYIKNCVQDVAKKVFEYSQEVTAWVSGEDLYGSLNAEYVPPTPVPAPEAPASEEVIDAPTEPSDG